MIRVLRVPNLIHPVLYFQVRYFFCNVTSAGCTIYTLCFALWFIMRKAFLPLNETCSGKMRKWERSDHMTQYGRSYDSVEGHVMQYWGSCDTVWGVI